jgi:hypothetical protein
VIKAISGSCRLSSHEVIHLRTNVEEEEDGNGETAHAKALGREGPLSRLRISAPAASPTSPRRRKRNVDKPRSLAKAMTAA